MPIRRDDSGPIILPTACTGRLLRRGDPSSVFNPGAVSWQNRELLLLRVQTRGRTTLLIPAERHPDGRIEIADTPIRIDGLDTINPRPAHVYDPRLTVIDGVLYAVCACDFADECRLLTARTTDFENWDLVALDPPGTDCRNGVFFPERIGGKYLRLQRPNRTTRDGAPPSGSIITLAESDDLVTWTETAEVMHGRPQRWDELIGSGPPPVKTREGWLHVYHGVATHFASVNIYQAGVVLLDLDDPARVVSRGAYNILEPREIWELTGQVPNVVFPTGMIVEQLDDEGFALPDSPVRVYYGAADTCVGLATSTIAELIEDARFQDPEVGD